MFAKVFQDLCRSIIASFIRENADRTCFVLESFKKMQYFALLLLKHFWFVLKKVSAFH